MYKLSDITPSNLPLEFVKDYLRIDYDSDDVEIGIYIKASQDYIRKYIGANDTDELDFNLLIPILSLIAYCYENKTVIIPKANVISPIFSGILNIERSNIL